MRELILKVPEDLTANNVLEFARVLGDVRNADKYVFDLGRVKFVEPFGMLLGGALLRQFSRQKKQEEPKALVQASDYKNHSYASVMGFYKSFGLNHGKAPGEAPGNARYIPITRLPVRKLYETARSELVVIGEAIEAESLRIARVLTQQHSGNLVDTLTYSLREIFRNVVEHSAAGEIWYAAQYWPTRGKVEIGILDEGIGITRSLARNQTLSRLDDQNALHLAVQPGVSGSVTAEQMQRRKDTDVWMNSGYGLYMTSEICRDGGNFLICSGSKALGMSSAGAVLSDTAFSGTAIQLVFDTSTVSAITARLDSIRKAGEALAGQSGHGGNLSASMISRMLSRPRFASSSPEDPILHVAPGMRVVHKVFGSGTVMTLLEEDKASVLFDEYGTKTLLLRRAGLVEEPRN
jgi:hypothetical protein